MDIDHRFAPVELGEHRVESGIARPFVVIAGVHADTVSLEHVHAILDLGKTALDIRQWQRGEHAETPAMIGDEPCRIFVAASRQASALFIAGDVL